MGLRGGNGGGFCCGMYVLFLFFCRFEHANDL